MNYYHTEKNRHTAIILIAFIFVASFIAYDYFLNNLAQAQTDPLLTSTSDTGSPFSPENLALLKKIESIKLDSTFFKDPLFVSLHDWTIDLGREDAGRINPFLPLNSGVKTVSPTTKTR